MPARRTQKAAPRRSAGARRAKAAVTGRARKAARPARAAAARRRRTPAPSTAAAPRPRAAKPATRAAAVRDLERGCDAVLAAIRGLPAAAAERPIAPGRWTPRQILLHMAYWDEWMLGVLPAAITRGRDPEALTDERVEAANARAVASGADLPWDEVRNLWATQRALLLGLLAAVPASPAARWSREHALGRVLDGYADHDRHHAAQIRDARRAKRPAFTPAFAAQAAHASAKELLLFELQRGRVAVRAALQGLGAATAERPVAPGKWSPREIVLHLAESDRMRLEEFDALLAGTPPSWDPDDYQGMAGANEAHLAPLRALSWDESLRRLESSRARLLSALAAAPAEPAERWTKAHPFGATMLELPRHDRHHAEQIKSARISS